MNDIKINLNHECDKNRVLKSNILIHYLGLVFQSFGNVSGRDSHNCLIKPSGVDIYKISSDYK